MKLIFKGGLKNDPANYRPVGLTSVAGKIMERIIKNVIEKHFDENDLWCTEQHGFKQGCSCLSNLLLAREYWTSELDGGNRVDVIYVDFSKAFDRVSHSRLLQILTQYGISGSLYAWIEDFLINRSMRVKVNDVL